MSITLSDGIYASSGLTVTPQLLSGSMEFNGTDQYLTTPSNAAFTLTSDFTIECWFYDTDIAATEALFGKRPDSITYGGVGLGHAGNSNLDFLGTITGSNWEIQLNSTIATPANQWHHVAITRLGNVYTMWVNGQSASTQTEAGALLANPAVPFTIGATAQDGTSPWSGYISNLRIVNGIAVYTSAFTPSSSPLTVVQPQNFNGSPSSFIYSGATVLLLNTTNNDFNFLDMSDNHFILTGPNMPTPSLLTPFFGSLLFNGTSDFLTIPSGVPTTSATWTIEFWIYSTDNSTQQSFVSTNVPGLNFWKYPGTGQLILDDGQYGQPPIDAYISVNTWTHLAIVRNGDIGATAVYKDGILVGSSVGPYGPLNSTLYIGNYAGSQFYYTGYMSNFRYVSGVAVYTNNFIPSTNQLTSVQGANVNGSPSSAISGSQTKLLLNTQYNNGTYLLDSSSNHYNVLGPNMPVPSAANPFEPTGSLSFNGSNNVVYVESNTEFEFGTGDFTTEGWYYWNTFDNNADSGLILLGTGANGGADYSAWWMRYYSSGFLSWYRYDGTSEIQYTFPITLNTGQWYHIACTRSGTDLRFFVNGTQVGAAQTCTTDYTIVNSDPLQIGKANTGNSPGIHYFNGYASNIRVVKGVAVYTSSFTPSTTPLTATQSANVNGSPSSAITGTQTSLLLNTPYNVNFLLDSSTYNVTITNNGTATKFSYNPFSGFITLTSTTPAAVVLNMAALGGFTYTGGGGFTVADMSNTRTFSVGNTSGGSITVAPNLYFTSGASIATLTTASWFNNLDFGTTSFAIAATALNIAGDLTLSSGGTYTNLTAIMLDTGTATLTTNGKTIAALTINGPAGSFTFAGIVTVTGALTLTSGTVNTSYAINSGSFASTGTATRGIVGTNITYTVSSAGATAFSNASGTGLTMSGIIISMTNAAAKTFAGGGGTYSVLNQGGAGALTISGSNNFDTISNSVQPTTFTFTINTTQTVNNFNVAGIAGSLVTINSSTAATAATLSKASGTVYGSYLSIQDSTATGGATWYAGSTSTNVSNNTGWIFTRLPIVTFGNLTVADGGFTVSDAPVVF